MICREDPNFGWGVGGLPMPRQAVEQSAVLPCPQPAADLARLARDLPWRALAASAALTAAALVALLLLDRHLPPIAARPTAAPVAMTVRWQEQAPEPAVVPPEPPPAPRVRAPEPMPRPKPVPEVARPLPEPVRPAVVAGMPPAPPRVEPAPRAEPAPVQPPQPVKLERHVAAELGPGPDLRPRGERTREERLPDSGAVALSRSGGLDLATAPAGAPRERYLDRAGGPDLPAPVRGEAVAKDRAAEFDPGPGPKLNRRVPERPPAAAAPALRLAAIAGPAAPEAAVPGPAASPRKGPASPAARLADAGTSFDYLDRVAPADLDRLHLVSLNRLRTCLDPEAEMRLRTRLASLLGRPATCRTGGVIFDFRQPESAWSLHVDIYNYEGREFQDRCAALRLAVDCCERTRR